MRNSKFYILRDGVEFATLNPYNNTSNALTNGKEKQNLLKEKYIYI